MDKDKLLKEWFKEYRQAQNYLNRNMSKLCERTDISNDTRIERANIQMAAFAGKMWDLQMKYPELFNRKQSKKRGLQND